MKARHCVSGGGIGCGDEGGIVVVEVAAAERAVVVMVVLKVASHGVIHG